MKRQLSAREAILLVILFSMLLVGGYWLLFYTPMTQELELLEAERIAGEEQIEAVMLKTQDKQRMEAELAEIFAKNPDPVSLAPYDNQKPVMFELNTILQSADDYSLSFSTADSGGGDGIVRRVISLSFNAATYEAAKEVLGKLHDSVYRCMLDSLNVSLDGNGGRTSVAVTLVFFEYQ